MPAVTIRVDSKLVRDRLGKIITRLPMAAGKDAKKIGEFYRAAIRQKIIERGLTWKRKLYDYTRLYPLSGGKKGYQITMPYYGLWHEYGGGKRPRWLSLDNPAHAPIGEWAREKLGKTRGFIMVRPAKETKGKFIGPAVREATKRNMQVLMRGEVSKLVLEGK